MDLIEEYRKLKKNIEKHTDQQIVGAELLYELNSFEKALSDNLFKVSTDVHINLKSVVDQISDGIVIFEKNGDIVIWNSGAENITGIMAEDAINKKLPDIQYAILHGKYKNRDLIEMRFNETVSMANPRLFNNILENEIFVPNIGIKIIQFSIFPIIIESNYLFGTVIRDITDQKLVENQLRELNATKDKLFSIIAHDLRSPFNSLIGISNLLSISFEELNVEKVKQFVEQLNVTAKSTLSTLDNILEWAKSQTNQICFAPELFSLNKITLEVFNVIQPQAKLKSIELNYFFSGEIIVFADKYMIKSVIRNLLSNAIKFSEPKSKISVYAVEEPGCIEITVSDNGIGLDEEKKQSLFRIETTKSTRGTAGEKGSGIGLILCKEFVEKHGGRIWVESQLGEGSDFKFTIPIKSL